jgi:RNA polymerase sigma factor (sigma-70 family)
VNSKTAFNPLPFHPKERMFQVFIPKKPASLTRRSQPNRLCDDQSRSNKPFGLLLDSGNQMVGGAVLTLGGKDQLARFEQAILPHLDAAYNLARWLTRNDHDAQDMVQEACLRAFKFFDGFHGVDARAWLLTIVRNTCYTWLEQNRRGQAMTSFDEEIHTVEEDALNPSALALKSGDREMLKQSLEQLPAEFREVIVLRDLEELSYKQIAEVINVPLGTVMSRLARARARLKGILCSRLKEKP